MDSKFGFAIDDVPRAIAAATKPASSCAACTRTSARRSSTLDAFEKLGEVLAGMGDYPLLNLGGGLGIAYTDDEQPPSVEDYVDALLRNAPEGVTVLCEPGRSLVGNAGVTIYTVGTVKGIPGVRTYVAVDGGMSDNLRPMLYGARYEAEIADRFGGDELCTVAGMHCESGDILVRDVQLDDPRVGDMLVIPATGAYGHAMANNYNAIPRPPVIFCTDGDARVVVRRETYEDLTLRDLSRFASGCSATARSARPSHELLEERADAIEAETGMRPEIVGRPDTQPRRLRRHPRAQRPDRRADRRHRAGARLHPARDRRRPARRDRQQAGALPARRGDLRRRAPRRRAAALRGAPWPAWCPPSA